jgi:N-acetylneuraminate synthase
MSTFIIAEAGVNHNGSLRMALDLVDAAADAGADAVKFQTFKSEAVISRYAVKADYQKRTTESSESQLDMVKKLELDLDAHRELVRRCRERRIAFLSTPFDLGSVDLLAHDLGLETLKLPSGEITHAPLLLKVAQTGCNAILSTGMSTLGEIEAALGVLAFGYTGESGEPSVEAFRRAYESEAGQAALAGKVSLLHCTTEYPAPFADVNLRVLGTLRTAFGLPAGLSDHTSGIAVPIAAVGLGAAIIEKHFTLDRRLPGPDHPASLEPGELAAMVRSIREVEAALGGSRKMAVPSELKNRSVARKSLVAAEPVAAGERFTERNLTCKRPGTGISPMEYWSWLGKAAQRDYGPDELIDPHGD